MLLFLQAAMKAVVATSRMHEGSRRRTDSCEIPNSDKPPQPSGPQRDTSMDASGKADSVEEGTEKEEKKSEPLHTPSPPSHEPHSPKPPVLQPGPVATRPPLKVEGLRQTSVLPKAPVVRPRVPKKSYSMDPGGKSGPSPILTTPPSPKSISNGFTAGVETGNNTTECQWIRMM